MFKWIRDLKRLPQVERELEATKESEKRTNRIYCAIQLELKTAHAKIDELQGKIRKQTEADLLLVSMQIVQRIAAGEKKESPPLQSLLAQQAAMMQNVYPYGALGQGAALGMLGGIFDGAAASPLPWQ